MPMCAIQADLLAGVSERNYRALNRTLGFVTVQYNRGLRSGRDIALIRSDTATAEAGLESARNAKRNALRALEALIGRYPGGDLKLPGILPAQRTALPAGGLPAALLEARPDLQSAAHGIDAAYAHHRIAIANTRPNLTLSGFIGGELPASPVDLAWTAAVNLAAPLIDAGRRRSDVEAAAADVDAAMALYRDAALTAWTEVEDLIDLGQALETQDGLIEAARTEAGQALKFTEYAYEIGQADLLDVLVLQQRLAALEGQQVTLRAARLTQFSQLSLALGGTHY